MIGRALARVVRWALMALVERAPGEAAEIVADAAGELARGSMFAGLAPQTTVVGKESAR